MTPQFCSSIVLDNSIDTIDKAVKPVFKPHEVNILRPVITKCQLNGIGWKVS